MSRQTLALVSNKALTLLDAIETRTEVGAGEFAATESSGVACENETDLWQG